MVINVFRQFARKMQIDNAEKRLERVKDLYDVGKIYDLNYMGGCNENHNCDVYYPHGTLKEKLPVIMEIHGGGFCTGSKLVNEPHGLWYASKGYKVVNVNYTLHPESNYVDEMQELFAALHWIEKNADEYGFDLDRLFISGDSAGGFHVLLISAIQHSEELQKYYNVEPVARGIRGTAATCPCSDVREIMSSKRIVWRIIRPLAFPNGMNEDYIQHISSPGTFAMSDYPKVFISTSKDDSLLYPDSKRSHKQLAELGIDHIYKEYTGKSHKLEHVWNVLYPDWEESIEVNEDFIRYFEEMSK